MDASARHPTRHPGQLGGRVAAFLVFAACTLVGVRNLWLEPRTSPFDAILWTGLVAMGGFLCVVTVAAMRNRPLLGRTAALDARIRLVPNGLMIALALAGLVTAVAFERWLVAAANSLVIAASLYNVRLLRRRVSRSPASAAGPHGDDSGGPA